MTICFQFIRYYESGDDVTPPVKLEPCLTASGEQVFLAEPLVSVNYLNMILDNASRMKYRTLAVAL